MVLTDEEKQEIITSLITAKERNDFINKMNALTADELKTEVMNLSMKAQLGVAQNVSES